MKNYEKGDLASKRATEIYENIKHNDELKLIATQTNHDSTQSKKVTSVVKKKVSVSTKKSNKTNSPKRLASL
jgi:hypothetical protein